MKKRFKIVSLVTVALASLAGTVAVATQHDRITQGELNALRAAQRALEEAEDQLERAGRGWGGHKAKAEQQIEEAQKNLRDALTFAKAPDTETAVTREGHVVHVQGDRMVFVTTNGNTFVADLSRLDRDTRRQFQTGQAVRVIATPRDTRRVLNASRVTLLSDQPPNKYLHKVHGTITAVDGDSVTVRLRDGRGEVTTQANPWMLQMTAPKDKDSVVLFYEEGPKTEGRKIARWIERDR